MLIVNRFIFSDTLVNFSFVQKHHDINTRLVFHGAEVYRSKVVIMAYYLLICFIDALLDIIKVFLHGGKLP